MTNDGYSLDVKRTPVEGSNIPDIIERFNNLHLEKSRSRTDQSFLVPVDEIRKNDYDLSFNKYKQIEKVQVNYRPTSEILADIKKSYEEAETLLADLEKMLKE